MQVWSGGKAVFSSMQHVACTTHDECHAQLGAVTLSSSNRGLQSIGIFAWHGWQTLMGVPCCCRMMIERTGGCLHMTCRCGNDFQMST